MSCGLRIGCQIVRMLLDGYHNHICMRGEMRDDAW